jgi:hypothetical protein
VFYELTADSTDTFPPPSCPPSFASKALFTAAMV